VERDRVEELNEELKRRKVVYERTASTFPHGKKTQYVGAGQRAARRALEDRF